MEPKWYVVTFHSIDYTNWNIINKVRFVKAFDSFQAYGWAQSQKEIIGSLDETVIFLKEFKDIPSITLIKNESNQVERKT